MRTTSDVVADLLKLAKIDLTPHQLFTYIPFPEDLKVRFETIAKNVVPAGKMAPEIDHVTLLYIPKSESAVAESRVDEIVKELRDTCEHIKPLKAKIQGWAYFDGAQKDGEKKTALVGLIDCPGLEDLHVELKSTMGRLGLKDAGTHGFTPHVTFAYLDQGERVANLPLLDGEFDIDKVVFCNSAKHEIRLLGHQSLGEKAAAWAFGT